MVHPHADSLGHRCRRVPSLPYRLCVSGSDEPGLPIKFGPCASDEYEPRPLSRFVREVVRRAQLACDDNARRLAMSRRDFLRTACAAATTLLVLDACSKEAHRAAGTRPGGTFVLPRESSTEPAAAGRDRRARAHDPDGGPGPGPSPVAVRLTRPPVRPLARARSSDGGTVPCP